MPNNITRGVRKVNENLLTDGRAIIITEQDKDQYFWDDIPIGSKLINTTDGTEYVKLKGESDWVPSKIKNDGTLSIAKDSIVRIEIFKIENLDEGSNHFCYTNSKGEKRHQTFSDEGYMFELEEGSYQMYRNHLDVLLDDCLIRNATSGGLIELTPRRFLLKNELVVGEEITVRYINTIRLGNPYPRIFESKLEPEAQDAEIGDLWVQYDYTLEDADRYQDPDGKIDWSIIKNTPHSLAGYGIYDKVAAEKHTHDFLTDIKNFPDKVSYATKAGTADSVKAFTLSLSKDAVGSTTIDGSNANISVTIPPEKIADIIENMLKDTKTANELRKLLQVVRIQSGTFRGATNDVIQIPDGANRDYCHFIVNANGGRSIIINKKGKVTNSTISGTASTSDVWYLAIEVSPVIGKLD